MAGGVSGHSAIRRLEPPSNLQSFRVVILALGVHRAWAMQRIDPRLLATVLGGATKAELTAKVAGEVAELMPALSKHGVKALRSALADFRGSFHHFPGYLKNPPPRRWFGE